MRTGILSNNYYRAYPNPISTVCSISGKCGMWRLPVSKKIHQCVLHLAVHI